MRPYPALAGLVLGATLSGLAMGLFALSSWPWIVLGFVGFVPWLAALERVRSPGGALLAGWLMSLAYVIGVGFWIPSVINEWLGTPWVVGLLLTLLFAPLIQPQLVAFALVRHLARGRDVRTARVLAPLAAACTYVGVDWLFPKLFHDTLGHWLIGASWLRQGADLVGVLGLTLVLLLANECALALGQRLWRRTRDQAAASPLAPALGLVLLVLLPSAYGAVRYQQHAVPGNPVEPVRFALVQSGFSHFNHIAEVYGHYLTTRTILDTHIAMSREAIAAERPDVLVWPETVYPLSFGTPMSEPAMDFDDRLREVVWRTGLPLVFGARDVREEHWFNAAFLLAPAGAREVTVDVYHKTHLFPFVESAPGLLEREFFRKRFSWLGTFTRGAGPRTMTLPLPDGRQLTVAPMICYDALNSRHAIESVRSGAKVLLTLSNDSWFEYGMTPRHVLHISAFRSIETRRPQVRAAVTGISSFITPTGEIVARLDTGAVGTLVATVMPAHGSPPALRLGPAFGPAMLVAALLLLVAARRGRPLR